MKPEPVWSDAPRYGPDEPWPPYAFRPGAGLPHPNRDPDGHSYGREEDDEFGFERGIDLYHAGYLWEAHEAWEGVWKQTANEPERAFLQALVQMTAMFLKRRQGQEGGVRKLAARAHANLDRATESFRGLRRAEVRALLGRESPGPLPLSLS